MSDREELLDRLLAGDRRALARALTVAESGDPTDAAFLEDCYRRGGRSLRVGLTGAPGVGKSSLVDGLALELARRAGRVAVLAVDPSSPFSRGALLGDRIRMSRSAADERVFVRSLASRGHLGGLSVHCREAADVVDAAGVPMLVIETVGVGQAEVDVAFETDLVVVVLAPGAGDGIQALKAGLMEIADIFVVNKCELEGAERVRADVEGALELAAASDRGRPPVLLTSAASDQGVAALADRIVRLGEERSLSGRLRTRRLESARRRLVEVSAERHREGLALRLAGRPDLVEAVAERRMAILEALAALEGEKQ